jgi:hypothetical protein
VFVDRVSDFRIRNNVMQHGDFGVATRLASGTLEGNLLAENGEATAIGGGSLTQPATVLLHANRATRNGAHGFMSCATSAAALVLDPGSNPPDLAGELSQPLQTTFDRNNPADLQNIPDTLTVTLSENDASDNGDLGIRFMGGVHTDTAGPLDYSTADDTQPLTGTLTATVVGNTSVRNGDYGVVIEGAFTIRNEARPFVQNLSVHFEGNSFVGNGRAGALVAFWYWGAAVGTVTRPLQAFKFAQDSTYQVTDADGELAGFDYDNPLMDPLSGAVLNNTLTVNGVEVPHGKSITPP